MGAVLLYSTDTIILLAVSGQGASIFFLGGGLRESYDHTTLLTREALNESIPSTGFLDGIILSPVMSLQ